MGFLCAAAVVQTEGRKSVLFWSSIDQVPWQWFVLLFSGKSFQGFLGKSHFVSSFWSWYPCCLVLKGNQRETRSHFGSPPTKTHPFRIPLEETTVMLFGFIMSLIPL